MQPLNDDELRAHLREWQAPAAPAGLEQRILAAARPAGRWRWVQWLVTGSVRVPAPVCIGVAVALLLLALQVWPPAKPVEPGFQGFQPVDEIRPRLIRTSR
ncbi:MAG: hypothetical protein ACKV22_30325 [Bryobacteraceae bacterium]